MADRDDLDFTYSLIDRMFRLSLGELADFSGAKYDGDFSLTLEQAQARKHDYVARQIGIGPGRRVLDLGCGWGPLLHAVRRRGGIGVGVTLSSAQLAACQRHGLDVHLLDARQVTRDTFGPFDAVASLGAFEHFCSPEEHLAGRQEQIYAALFASVADLLPDGGRFYLQTMVFGRNMIPYEAVDIDAPRDSDAWYLALMGVSSPARGCRRGRHRSSTAPRRTSRWSPARTGDSTTSRRSRSGAGASVHRASRRPGSRRSWRRAGSPAPTSASRSRRG